MDRIDILTKSFGRVDGKNKCNQTNAPLLVGIYELL